MVEDPHRADKAVGRRIRVKRRAKGGIWLEGKVIAFDATKGRHTIQYDGNKTRTLTPLGKVQYEWKDDPARLPIQQIDLFSGRVLRTFASIADAAADIGPNADLSRITDVCQGNLKSYNDTSWRFTGSAGTAIR